MAGSGGAVRHRSRAAIRTIVATAVVAGTAAWISAPQRAEATLPGSTFNGADASPASDLAAGAVVIADPVGNQDTSNYTGGTEDDVCPPVQTGTASPKDDLDAFYFGSTSNSSGAFLYVAWHRPATNGTATIDFEVNRAAGVKAACNGVNPPRTAGDLLITYDFHGSGPFVLDIHQRTWAGDSDTGAWGLPSPMAPGSFEASINNDGSFGELVVNLTLANVLGTTGCESFATVFPKSRSSSQSFTNAIKEFVPPMQANVSNCGSIPVHKQDDAGAPLAGVVFDLFTNVADAPGAAVVPAQSCTTGATGDCTIDDVYPGTYWVVERAAPVGYTGADPQKVVVTLDGNTPAGTRTFVNGRKPGAVNIVKTNDAGAALAGAGFTLYTDASGSPGSAVSGKTCTTGVAGTCSITGIPAPGVYWVVETTTPAGHYTADAQQVDLALDETATVDVENVRKPIGLSLVKTVDGAEHPEGDPLFTESGQEVQYVLTVKNTGELPLTITALTDSLNAGVLDDCEQGLGSELAPGADFTCTYTASPTEDAANEASVTGTDLFGRTTSASDEAFVVPLHPAIRLAKTGPSGAHVGDVVVYTFTVTNPGDTGLTDVTVTDPKCAGEPELTSRTDGDEDASLDPGDAWVFTCAYTVKAADGGSVANEAAVSGTDRLGTTVSWDDDHVFPVLRPAISIDKSASPTTVAVSGTVAFTYVVTNTGDTTLFDISVDDDVLGHVGDIASLEPGQSRTLLTSMTVAAGSPTVNVGTAIGSDGLGREVQAQDSATITLVLGTTIVGLVDLPRTGSDVGLWLRLSGTLVAVGLTLVVTARRRRSVSVVGQSTSD